MIPYVAFLDSLVSIQSMFSLPNCLVDMPCLTNLDILVEKSRGGGLSFLTRMSRFVRGYAQGLGLSCRRSTFVMVRTLILTPCSSATGGNLLAQHQEKGTPEIAPISYCTITQYYEILQFRRSLRNFSELRQFGLTMQALHSKFCWIGQSSDFFFRTKMFSLFVL